MISMVPALAMPLAFFGTGLFGLVALAFFIWMIVDCARNETNTGNTKLIWILVIIFVPFGALVYFFVRKIKRMP
jgi:hypothetical protein